jgi:glycosyltransferase involved in cell wall biosynthesis
VDDWIQDESNLEALFLGEIAEAASPTIVHSAVTASMFLDRYGIAPAYIPFSIYRPWQPEELTQPCRSAARLRLGLQPGEVAICSFGFVHATKAPEECVWALEQLRGWGIPATLHFVGVFEPNEGTAELRPLIAKLGLEPYVRFATGYVSEETYRDYLVGADLAVQLRTYDLGSLSGAVMDCAAAGLPTVTNQAMGTAIGVPDYFRCIPDALSPVLLAEALADLLAAGLAADRPEPSRRAFSEKRSFQVYARQLCEVLKLETTSQTTGKTVLVSA